MYQVCQGFWVPSYLRPGVRNSSLRSEFNLVQRNGSLRVYDNIRAHLHGRVSILLRLEKSRALRLMVMENWTGLCNKLLNVVEFIQPGAIFGIKRFIEWAVS